MSLVLQQIANEQARQTDKWGVQNHSAADWMVILMEEVGEAAREIFEKNPEKYRAEMVQVAAVAASAIESFDRRGLEER